MSDTDAPQGPWRRPPKQRAGAVLWLVVAAGMLGALTAFLISNFPEALVGGHAKASLISKLTLLAVIGGSAILHRRTAPGKALKHAAVWIAVFAALLLAYSLRHEGDALWSRMAGELLPHRPIIEGDVVTLRAQQNGHFVAEAVVDGVDIRFLVDTGAGDVVLSPDDALRLGLDLKALSYTRAYQTANGPGFGAPVRLRSIAIGPIVLKDVRASVNAAAMPHSLLGMSFLSLLSGYEAAGDKLTLRR